jgi:hypothetical protein
MRLLPPQTLPAPWRIERLHRPRGSGARKGFQRYRSCLRWEFGFTCAFCLLHEADLVEHGAEGTGLTSVEHFAPVSAQQETSNQYANCFYACRFCNRARGTAPVVTREGRRLLNPCDDVWGDCFLVSSEDLLLPAEGDPDAAYTAQAYDLNDPRKVVMRRSRRERLEEWLQLLREGPNLEAELLQRTDAATPTERARQNLEAARSLRRCIEAALRDIQRYAVIPDDADASCHCGSPPPLEIPAWLGDQTPRLDDETGLEPEGLLVG